MFCFVLFCFFASFAIVKSLISKLLPNVRVTECEQLTFMSGLANRCVALLGPKEFRQIPVYNSVQLALSLEVFGGVSFQLVGYDDILPIKRDVIISTATDQQPTILIKILNGDSGIAGNNKLVAYLDVKVPPRPEKQAKLLLSLQMGGAFPSQLD